MRNVLPNPAQRQHLVFEGRIARIVGGAGGQQAERAQPVVERHQHNVPVEQRLGAGIVVALAGNAVETARMQIDENRFALWCGCGGVADL